MPDIRKIEEAVEPLVAQETMELVDLEWVQEGGRNILRFFLDKPGGFTLDDCEYMSNRIGALLDSADMVQGSYTLEISSPGLNRRLKRERDFLRFMGHKVKVRLKTPEEGGRRNFSGMLKMFEEGRVVVEIGTDLFKFPIDRIEEARLSPDVEFK